jgi:hypothetical protein
MFLIWKHAFSCTYWFCAVSQCWTTGCGNIQKVAAV